MFRKIYKDYYEKQLAQLVRAPLECGDRGFESLAVSFFIFPQPKRKKLGGNKMNRQIYIHYGAKQFDPLLNFPIKNEHCWVKPEGGLWASRINASFGWKDWCAREEFRDCKDDCSFKFVMRDENKIAVISTLAQLRRLPHIENSIIRSSYLIDFEKCLRIGIDAIELCWYGEEFEKVASGDLYFELYGWDCDSIVVLNPDAVIPR